MKRKIFSLTIVVFGLFNFLMPSTVYANNSYPYFNYTPTPCDPALHPGCVDPWNFYKRQCTSYAAHKINEAGYGFNNNMTGPNGQFGTFGNAGNWDNTASTIGFIVSSQPMVGSVAVWNPTQPGVGHVAWVESVNANNSVNISEYNFATPFAYGTRNGVVADAYIHLAGQSCGGSDIVIQNQTITGNYLCQGTNSIRVLPNTVFSEGSNVRLYN